MIERWLPITGYVGIYEVSDHGRTRRLPGFGKDGRKVQGKILKAHPNIGGYLYVSVPGDPHPKKLGVHVLVLEAFVGPRPGDSMIWQGCHNDGDRTNNVLPNLRWDTRKNNEADKFLHGTSSMGEGHPGAKLTEDLVREIRQRREAYGEPFRMLGTIYGVTEGNIRAICKRRSWPHVT